ncbi:MAG: hypothetical protein LC776_03495 [Acidobacteria bacterium]|nr:hypothetical protein [Acidobacteriota bacterium]
MKRATLSTVVLFALLICAGIARTPKTDATSLETPSQGPQGPTGPGLNQPGRKLHSLSLSKTSVIGGVDFSGTVRLGFVAPRGGTRVSFSTDPPFNPEGGNAALVPSGVTVPEGEANATFQITTFAVQSSRQVTIRASAGGVNKTQSFTVEPIRVIGLVIEPATGVGPFQARARVILSAFPVSDDTEVRLTSSNPAVVGFGLDGTAGFLTARFQQGNPIFSDIPIRARSVQQTTEVTINATLNGATLSRTVIVRPLL